jgi:hypothetical protein
MTATHAEVLRALPPELIPGAHGCYVRGESGACRWELELVAGKPLRVAALELEVTHLVIRLWGFDDAQRERFIARLETYTRRGGG